MKNQEEEPDIGLTFLDKIKQVYIKILPEDVEIALREPVSDLDKPVIQEIIRSQRAKGKGQSS